MSVEKDLKWYMAEYESLDAASKVQLIDQFKVEHARMPGNRHFCSLIQAPVVLSCSIQNCTYHVNNPAMLNCGLYNRGATPNRSHIDVAKTLNVKEDVAREMITKSLRKLRLASLRELMSQKKLNHYTMIPAKICVNCGSTISNETLRAGKFYYCSKLCVRERPPSLVRLEYVFKTDIRSVLLLAKQLFKSLILISNVLGIHRAHLIKFYDQYLGIRAHEFGTDVLDLIDLLRKRVPSPSIDSFIIVDQAKLKKYPHWAILEDQSRKLASRL